MKTSITLIITFLIFTAFSRAAISTSFGRIEEGRIDSISGKPAICLPKDTRESFPVGWITLSESYIKNPGGWSVALKEGVNPIILKPGECLAYGSIPEGYNLENYKIKVPKLNLQANRTYTFSINSATHPRDSYDAVFCISENSDGSRDYLQYRRLSDGSELIPSCDTKLNSKNFRK